MRREHILVHLLREGAEALVTAQRKLVNAEAEASALGHDPRGRLAEAEGNLREEWALYEKTLASVGERLRELDEIVRTYRAPDDEVES